MAIWQRWSKRKPTGGLFRPYRKKKRKRELGRDPILTKVSHRDKAKKIRVMGGNYKIKMLTAAHANVYIPEENRVVRVRINGVLENPANRHFSRFNIITKGAIIDTEIGKARVTNRPSQDGRVNAVLIEKKEK